MRWNEEIPRHVYSTADVRATDVVTVAGPIEGVAAPKPPPNSWAARPENELAIWTIRMEPGARWTLPPASAGIHRGLFFFVGGSMRVGDVKLPPSVSVR